MDEMNKNHLRVIVCVYLCEMTQNIHHHTEVIVSRACVYKCMIFIIKKIGKKGESVDLKNINVRKRAAKYRGFGSINYVTNVFFFEIENVLS